MSADTWVRHGAAVGFLGIGLAGYAWSSETLRGNEYLKAAKVHKQGVPKIRYISIAEMRGWMYLGLAALAIFYVSLLRRQVRMEPGVWRGVSLLLLGVVGVEAMLLRSLRNAAAAHPTPSLTSPWEAEVMGITRSMFYFLLLYLHFGASMGDTLAIEMEVTKPA